MIGGGAALLFAPKSGPELQEDIQAYVDQLVEEGKKAADVRRQDLEQQLDAFKQGRPLPEANSEG
jgi:gas vesicle protein